MLDFRKSLVTDQVELGPYDSRDKQWYAWVTVVDGPDSVFRFLVPATEAPQVGSSVVIRVVPHPRNLTLNEALDV